MRAEPKGFQRWPALDGARGLALVAMFIFHLCWDLAYFGFLPQSFLESPIFHGFGHAIAGSFILIAGIGLTLAARGGLDLHAALMRIGLIALAALGITAVTYLVFPDAFITFGILHLIALASLMALTLLKAPTWMVAAGAALVLILPLMVSEPFFDQPMVQWLGLGTHPPITNDWRPLAPWLGVMLIGLLLGRAIAANGLPGAWNIWSAQHIASRTLVLAGRHTLMLYLTHQPVFLALVFVAAMVFQPAADQITSGTSQFMSACEKQCLVTGGEAELCTRACTCIAEEARAQDMGRAVARNQLSPDEQIQFNNITKVCLRRLLPEAPSP